MAMMEILLCPLSCRPARRLFVLWFIALAAAGLVPAWPAVAQTPPAAAGASPPEAPLSAGELNALADRLENEAERRKLVETLRALAAARAAADKQPSIEEDPGGAIIDGMLDQMRRAGSAFAALGALFSDLPSLADWLRIQVENPRRRALWTDVLVKLGITLAVAVALQVLAYALVRRPIAALRTPRSETRTEGGEAIRPNPLLQLALAVMRALIGLVPIAVFAAAAYGTLALLAPNALTRDLAQIVVLAFVVVRAIAIAGEFLLANGSALPRALRFDEENAHYVLLWLRRLSAVAVYGYAVVLIVERVGIPADAVDTIAKLIAFAFAALLAVLILQARAPIAARIRGMAAAPQAAAAAASGTATEDGASRSRPWRVLRQRAGDIWHVLALLYVAASYAVWAFDVEGGFNLILRGTLLTVVILFLVRVLRFTVERGFGRLFAIGAETRRRFPGLELRANRYLPVLTGIIRGLLYVIAAFAILQAWGFDTLAWLASETGRGVVARVVTIILVLVITVALWEAIATGIEYYLTQPGPDGQPTPRSGRVRTLLPLLRRTVSIILGLIAGLIVLAELGINIAPLLAGAGVVGLAIGFGAQTLVKDVITGIFILTEDTVSVGDIVDLGGNAGVVEDISIRTIRLRDLDGIVHVIPYSEVTKIKNMTRDYAQAVFDIGVAYREDPDQVIEALKQLGEEFRAEPEWNARILDALEMMGVESLADSAVVIRCRLRTIPFQQWNVRREFLKRIKKRFDELGIEIPFPHRTLYFGIDKQGKAPPVYVQRQGDAEAAGKAPKREPLQDAPPEDMPPTPEKPAP